MTRQLTLFGLGLIFLVALYGFAHGAQQMMPASGQSWSTAKTAINSNFTELYSVAFRPWDAQDTAPSTCTVGDLWVDTNATAGDQVSTCTATNTWTKNRQLVGDCSEPPCLDGSADGGNMIKLWAGTGSYWTALQGGAPAANRSWRLPILAPPSAGETNVMTMDEYGQMAFLDKPSTSGYVLSSTDAGVLSWAAPATAGGDDLGDATYSTVVGLWTTCSGYLKSDGTCDTPSGSFSWPTSDGAYYAAKDGAWASLATVYQPLDSDLTTWAGVTSTANGRSLVSAANYAAMRTLLDLEAGTDFNAYDADLATLAAPTNWRVFYSNGSGVITQLALGADGTYLKSNGASAAPTWATPSGTMSWPASAGIAVYGGSSSWGTSLTLDTDLSTTSASDDTIPSAKATKALVDGLPTLSGGTGIVITEDGGGAGIDTINVSGVPSGTAPTVDAAGETAIDTTSDQLVYYGGAKRVLTYKKQIDFAVKTPVDADDFLLFKAQTAMTITDIHVIAQGGTSISVDIQECNSSGASCSTVDAAITADTDGAEDDGTLSNGTIDAGDWVKVVLGAPSGTVNYLAGSIYYVETAD